MLLHLLLALCLSTLLFLSCLSHSRDFSTHHLSWAASISDSAIVSAPNFIGPSHLVVTTHDGSVGVVDTGSGRQELPWPVHFPDKMFFATPLVYDIDQNGAMDILLTSSDGEIMFMSRNGTLLHSKSIVLPRLLIKRNWNIMSMDVLYSRGQPNMSPDSNTIFIENTESFEQSSLAKNYILMDMHILSTPVISDFNEDGFTNELIIPVNCYFLDDVKKDTEKLNSLSIKESAVDYYLANAVIIIDLTTKQIIFNKTLELTTKSSLFPCYLLSSPTVIDLDGENGAPEFLIGSMSGKIHVYNKFGKYGQDFSMSDSIHGEIAVGDVNNDGVLEVVVADRSGNVACFDKQGVLWEATVSGTMTAGPQLYDMNRDDSLDVIIAANDGYLWVLDGPTGHTLPNFPLKRGDSMHAKVLFVQHRGESSCVFMADEMLNIINITDNMYLQVVTTDVLSYTSVVLDPNHSSLIVSTTDGKLMSFQQKNKDVTYVSQKSTGVGFIGSDDTDIKEITASNFHLEFEIYDKHKIKHRWKSYNLTIQSPTENGMAYIQKLYEKPGVYTTELQSPQTPMNSYVLLVICNQFKECTQDIMYVKFYPNTQDSLVLYVLVPFLVMVTLLLLVHGYPDGDLLPTWQRSTSDNNIDS